MSDEKTRLLLVGSTIAVVLIAASGWYLYKYAQPDTAADIPLQNALSKISAVRSYRQNIITETAFSDRRLVIDGVYDIDSSSESYASKATTTLYIRGDNKGHIFTLQNVSMREDVYAKVETSDPLLSSTIQHSPSWLHFKSASIPKQYESIAVAGPIQDNLQVLSEGGTWLTLVAKNGLEKMNGTSLLHYTFTLSNKTPPQDGALSATLSRIGSGRVDLWIDSKTYEPKYLRFENPPYFSTTTIQNINSIQPITAPRSDVS